MNMDTLVNLTGWLNEANNFVVGKSFPLPFGQTILIMVLATVCLVWGKFKWGFLLFYSFIFYGVLVANKLFFLNLIAGNPMALVFYVFIGLVITLLIFYGFFQESH